MNIITLTEAAVLHLKNKLAQQSGSVGFRLSIKKTGCSGYAYVPEIIDHINPEDIHFIAEEELPVYVDRPSENFIKGLIIDYVTDEEIGLKQKRLVFINPNEKNRCGCGESFTIE